MEDRKARLVYTTFPDVETALAIGEALVRAGLAACINVLPGMRSVYAWNGAVERGEEAVGILKTADDRADELRAALKARHPYDAPAIFVLAPAGTDADTMAWLVRETRGERGAP